jgi:O-antigen/teichoic acid export membrane protein
MLEHYLGREAVGVYSVAYGSTTTLILFNGSINSAYVPQFIRAQTQPDGERFVARSVTYFWLTVLTASLGFVIFAPLLIRSLYATQFAEAARFSPMLALVAPLHAVYLVYVNVLFYVQRTRLIPLLTLTAGIINVVLNVFLIPKWGLAGAVAATLAGYVALAVVFRLGTWHSPLIKLEKSRLLRVIVVFSSIAITAFVLDGRFSIAIDIGIKVVLALLAPILLWASNFMTTEEHVLLRQRLSRIRTFFSKEPS